MLGVPLSGGGDDGGIGDAEAVVSGVNGPPDGQENEEADHGAVLPEHPEARARAPKRHGTKFQESSGLRGH